MLGFVLAPLGQEVPGQYPNEINYAYGGAGAYLEPADPQFNTRGEPGLYFDTPLGGLGAIPTDAELAKNYGYTPVTSGWVNAAEGFFPSPWRTPGGWNPAGKYGPPMSLGATAPNGMPMFLYKFGMSPSLWALAIAGGLGAWFYFKKRK